MGCIGLSEVSIVSERKERENMKILYEKWMLIALNDWMNSKPPALYWVYDGMKRNEKKIEANARIFEKNLTER